MFNSLGSTYKAVISKLVDGAPVTVLLCGEPGRDVIKKGGMLSKREGGTKGGREVDQG